MTGCKKGELRKKSYTKKDGTRVKSTCIKDKGKPGKGKKTLPKLGDEMHLSKFGYTTKAPVKKRKSSLRKASKKHGSLPVLRRLNLIRNYQADKVAKEIMSKDVEYMKSLYKKSKKQTGGDCGISHKKPMKIRSKKSKKVKKSIKRSKKATNKKSDKYNDCDYCK